ncbi:hypothetical protein FHX74_001309 [Friedmanniella endophytica]|uniref:Uncharacterized protein n=1 Tax=Microlunatus kandeliicorticis TaxID=1759536 RepID=A0A7W3IR54_9ACTN|nr:hypothetical protein [Microlunatus kandeliicorticis]MBA8793704.1 hypothetical protein [Microlunatus kandeliicorticis]
MTLLLPSLGTALDDVAARLAGLHVGSLGLVDLVIGLIVVGSVIGALRRRSGLLGAIGSGLGAAVFCWLAVTAIVTWAPAAVHDPVSASAFARTVPLPTHAAHQAGAWLQSLVGSVDQPDAGPRR